MLERLPEAPSAATDRTPRFEDSVLRERKKTRKVIKSITKNAGALLGVFMVFAVIVTATTEIHLTSFSDLTALGLEFFIVFFASYIAYVSCSDSGMRAGLNTETYTAAVKDYEVLKRRVVENDMQCELYGFCRHYISEELKNTRMNILATVGFTYPEYEAKWSILTDNDIDSSENLTDSQKKAVKKANQIRPINLTPEMIMRRGRNDGSRSPLGITPQAKKNMHFGFKFMSSVLVTLGVVLIVAEAIEDPTWEIFVSAVLRLIPIITRGVSGYRMGYENIVVDMSEYISDQSDLLQQAIKYIEKESSITNTHTRHEEGGINVCVNEINESASAVSPRANTM